MGITIEPTRCADLSSLSRRTFLSVGDRTSTLNNGNANSDSDLFIFYNQIKSVPGFVIEPYTLLDCIHRQPSLRLNYVPSTAARCNGNLRDTDNFGTRL